MIALDTESRASETASPIMRPVPARRPLRAGSGLKRSVSTARCTRRSVFSSTGTAPLSARDTVEIETFASAATSFMDAIRFSAIISPLCKRLCKRLYTF